MALTTIDQQFTETEASLQEPHFDEEATVLSARPVVPLESVRPAKTSFPRPWILGLGLVGALLVGIFGTVIYYSRSTGDDANLFQSEEVVAGAEAGEDAPAPANSFSGPAAPLLKVEEDVPAEVGKQTPERQSAKTSTESGKQPRARLVSVIKEKARNNHIEDESPEDRRAARRQARQERRRAERKRNDARSSDDLLRIREIFEGSPRP